MQFYSRAADAANRILSLFQSGNVPKALGPIFIHRHQDIPCRKWSWSNQLLVALAGHDDARGFRQWQKVNRHVRKGEHGFPILCPVTKKITTTDQDTGETAARVAVVGFTSTTVFGYDQTDGEALPYRQADQAMIDALPLVEVARSWGLRVDVDDCNGYAAGSYSPGSRITVAVENKATWAHELIHAADDRLNNLDKGKGQYWANEIVAELGGSVLLDCIGLDHDADEGGCWDYVNRYAKDAGIQPITAIQRVLKRTCDAVALVLAEYDRIKAGTAPELAAVA